MLPLLPFLLLAVPLTEIAVFVLVGSQIGVLPTIALVVLTAVTGAALLRHQGIATLMRIRTEVDAGRVPGRELVNGVMILAAGILLLTPGFVTDTIGLLLFVPPVRDFLWNAVGRRVVVVRPAATGRSGGARSGGGPVIDLGDEEFRREPKPDSPWRGPPAP